MKRRYPDADAELFDRCAYLLIRFLRNEEMIQFMDLIEDGRENEFFDLLNQHLMKKHPELFASSNDPTDGPKEESKP